MTSNVCNRGIAHLAFRIGGQPICKSRRAHISVTADDTKGYQICKRCEASLAKMRHRAARKGNSDDRRTDRTQS